MVVRASRYVHGILLAGVHLWEDNIFNNLVPRPLLPVAHQPLICHVLGWLRRGGIRQTTICANSTSEFVHNHLGTGARWKLALDYYEDLIPRGPAGCLHDAALHNDADTYLVADASSIPQFDLNDLLAAHEKSKACVTVVVSPEASHLASQQRPLAPAGIYVFDHKVLPAIKRTGYQDIKEGLIPHLHQTGCPIGTYVASAGGPRVSGFSSYLQANTWLLQQMAEPSRMLIGYEKVRDCHIHRKAHVDPMTRLVGPVLVEAGAVIEAGATVIGPTVVGPDSLVEPEVVVSRCVLWDRCTIGARAIVDHCLLSQDAYVPAGKHLRDTIHTTSASRSQGWFAWLRPPKVLPVARVAQAPVAALKATAAALSARRQRAKTKSKSMELTSAG